jgi:hypothetical protein
MCDITSALFRRCVGTPPAGMLACPNPATRWQVRRWSDGFNHYPARLSLCAACAAATASRSDVESVGEY